MYDTRAFFRDRLGRNDACYLKGRDGEPGLAVLCRPVYSSFIVASVGRPLAVARGGNFRQVGEEKETTGPTGRRCPDDTKRCAVGSSLPKAKRSDALSEKTKRCAVGSHLTLLATGHSLLIRSPPARARRCGCGCSRPGEG